MKFVHVSAPGRGYQYLAESEIVRLNPTTDELTDREGRTWKLANPSDIEHLIGNGIVRGVAVEGGDFVSVPLSAIDHVVDHFDEVTEAWFAIAVTSTRFRFAVDTPARALLGLDDEVFAIEELRASISRMTGSDTAAEQAVAEAAVAAGGRKRAVG